MKNKIKNINLIAVLLTITILIQSLVTPVIAVTEDPTSYLPKYDGSFGPDSNQDGIGFNGGDSTGFVIPPENLPPLPANGQTDEEILPTVENNYGPLTNDGGIIITPDAPAPEIIPDEEPSGESVQLPVSPEEPEPSDNSQSPEIEEPQTAYNPGSDLVIGADGLPVMGIPATASEPTFGTGVGKDRSVMATAAPAGYYDVQETVSGAFGSSITWPNKFNVTKVFQPYIFSTAITNVVEFTGKYKLLTDAGNNKLVGIYYSTNGTTFIRGNEEFYAVKNTEITYTVENLSSVTIKAIGFIFETTEGLSGVSYNVWSPTFTRRLADSTAPSITLSQQTVSGHDKMKESGN